MYLFIVTTAIKTSGNGFILRTSSIPIFTTTACLFGISVRISFSAVSVQRVRLMQEILYYGGEFCTGTFSLETVQIHLISSEMACQRLMGNDFACIFTALIFNPD